MELSGVFLLSLGRACVNLRVLAGPEWEDILRGVTHDGWYARAVFEGALDAIGRRFKDPAPVFERVGAEMMRLWYEEGPGRALVKNGRDFLRYQAGSEGYRSLVRGPDDLVGAFTLEALDEAAGTARVVSTTPFPRALERGVLLGGVQVCAGVDFVEVKNDADPSRFDITFR